MQPMSDSAVMAMPVDGTASAAPVGRIALFIPSLNGGGAERVMVSLANGLVSRNLDVDLVLAREAGVYLNDVSRQVRIVGLDAGRALEAMWPLARYLRSERPATLVSAMNYVNVIAHWARRLSGAPTRVVFTEHANLSQLLAALQPLMAWSLPKLMRPAYARAHSIIAVSDGVADDLAHTLRIDRSLVHTRHNPIETAALAAKAREPLDHPWFAPEEPPVIVAAGRLSPEKDFPTLIRAFSLLRRRRPARLAILGEGGQRAGLQAQIDALEHGRDVLLAGFQTNPYAWMGRAAVFVLSSRWEGFGNVLVEAMACGTPVVSTACPSGPEEILEGGRWGRLAAVGDADGLAEAMDRTLQDEQRPDVRLRAHDFSVDRVVDAYLPLLLPCATAQQ